MGAGGREGLAGWERAGTEETGQRDLPSSWAISWTEDKGHLKPSCRVFAVLSCAGAFLPPVFMKSPYNCHQRGWVSRPQGKKMKFYVGSTKGWKDRAARGKMSETDYLLETGNSLLRTKSLHMASAHQHSLCVGYCCLLAWAADGWPRRNQS